MACSMSLSLLATTTAGGRGRDLSWRIMGGGGGGVRVHEARLQRQAARRARHLAPLRVMRLPCITNPPRGSSPRLRSAHPNPQHPLQPPTTTPPTHSPSATPPPPHPVRQCGDDVIRLVPHARVQRDAALCAHG